MKNTQYVNQCTCHINEIFRLTLNETLDGTNFNTVGVFAMHVDFAEILAKAVLDAVEQHKRNVENQKANNSTDKGLN